jgi:hypothetical protein
MPSKEALLSNIFPWPAGEAHWRSMAADEVNHFWFTNREARILFAEIDRLRAENEQLRKKNGA